MGQLHVLFEVPRYIEHGLATGTFQRVGGVIVESGSKQVVAWLRDGSLVETGLKLATSAANPLGMILQAGQMASSLIDGHLTRNAIGALGEQIVENHLETMRALSALGQSVQTIGTLTMLTASGQVINLAMSAATFRTIIRRLDKLSATIDELGQRILAEFDRDRDMRFKIALQAARDAFESQGANSRDIKAQDATLGLFEARENFFIDLDNILKTNPDNDKLLLASQLLIRAMYAETSRIRCYMITGENELAKQRLGEDIPRFKAYTENLIKAWFNDKQAIYFHKDVPADYLARFFYIQQWLRGIDNGNDTATMFQIVDEFRGQFWNKTVLNENLFHTIRGLGSRLNEEKLAELSSSLLQAELLIENYSRLAGFEMEIRTMNLSFDEWTNLVSDEDLEEHGVGLIVDDEIADRYECLAL